MPLGGAHLRGVDLALHTVELHRVAPRENQLPAARAAEGRADLAGLAEADLAQHPRRGRVVDVVAGGEPLVAERAGDIDDRPPGLAGVAAAPVVAGDQ